MKNSHNQLLAERSYELTKKSIAFLIKYREVVTLKRIEEVSKKIDTEGKGITARTVLRNKRARKLFQQNSLAAQKKGERNSKKSESQESKEALDIPLWIVNDYSTKDQNQLLQKIHELQTVLAVQSEDIKKLKEINTNLMNEIALVKRENRNLFIKLAQKEKFDVPRFK